MSKSINISNSVIRRLPRYYRFLGELEDQQISKISSRELSERMHLTASQIRQDLNCFGGFGQQGYGYNVSELRKEIGRILGVDLPNTVELTVVETDPGIRGDTATGGSKPAKMDTGYVVKVPLFINEGDVLRIDTRTGEYIERA